MRTHPLSWDTAGDWRTAGADFANADFVLFFGLRAALLDGARCRQCDERILTTIAEAA